MLGMYHKVCVADALFTTLVSPKLTYDGLASKAARPVCLILDDARMGSFNSFGNLCSFKKEADGCSSHTLHCSVLIGNLILIPVSSEPLTLALILIDKRLSVIMLASGLLMLLRLETTSTDDAQR